MSKQGRGEVARGTGAPRKPQLVTDRPTVRMPASQIREVVGTPADEEIDADPILAAPELAAVPPPTPRPRPKKRTATPMRKPAEVRRSSPDELIALLRKNGLREPRR